MARMGWLLVVVLIFCAARPAPLVLEGIPCIQEISIDGNIRRVTILVPDNKVCYTEDFVIGHNPGPMYRLPSRKVGDLIIFNESSYKVVAREILQTHDDLKWTELVNSDYILFATCINNGRQRLVLLTERIEQ